MPRPRKIPRIDLRKLTGADAADRRRSVTTLGDSLCQLGFLRVEGHDIDGRLVAKSYGLWKQFFLLPTDEKAALAGSARGFTPFGVEHAKNSPVPDLKEFFHVGQEVPAGHRLRSFYPDNVWPAAIPGLREVSLELYRSLEATARALLEGLAEYFGLPLETFAAMMDSGNTVHRILHYPAIPVGADPAAVRAAEHADINLITILPEATDSGLEILTDDGTWLPVVANAGELVVDSGDMLARVTNDIVPATTHRVVNLPEAEARDRYSMPFFVHPFPDCDLSVQDIFVSAGRPARYPPITAHELLEQRLREIGL